MKHMEKWHMADYKTLMWQNFRAPHEEVSALYIYYMIETINDNQLLMYTSPVCHTKEGDIETQYSKPISCSLLD